MAKVSFTKLGLTKNTQVNTIDWYGQAIEIKEYLPVEDKLTLMANVINYSADDHVFYNPCKVEIFKGIEIILAYTNISVTDKQKEDITKLYDLFVSSGFYDAVINEIDKAELDYINIGITATINEIYRYKNSAMGVMEQINTAYKDLVADGQNITEILSNPEQLTLLKDVMTKLD